MAKVIGGTTTTPMRMPESGGGEKPWELLEDIILEEAVYVLNFDKDKINSKSEVHIEGYIVPTDTTITNQTIQFNDGSPLWQATVNCKATGSVKLIMDIYKSPRNKAVFDGSVSCYDYALSGGGFKITKMDANLTEESSGGLINFALLSLRTTSANPMAVGTRIKVWGR